MLRARTDYDVTAVDDGEKALALALADPTPDVLLLDWMMPGLSGTDVCARVRESRLALHLQTLNILSREKRVEDSIVVTDTRYHLVRFIPRAPDCFVYLVVDAKQALIAAARLGLQRAVEE